MRESIYDSFEKLKKDDTKWLGRKGQIYVFDEMDIWHVFYTYNLIKRAEKLDEKTYVIPDKLMERVKEHQKKFPEYWI